MDTNGHKYLIRSLAWALLFIMPWQINALEYSVEVPDESIENNVLTFLETKTYDCRSLSSEVGSQYKDLVGLVQQAIQPFGYFNARIQVAVPQINGPVNQSCDHIGIKIELGPVTLINLSEIRLVDSSDADLIQVIDNNLLQAGQILNQVKYEQLKSQLLNLASEKLYLDAKFLKQTINVYPEKNEADIKLLFSPGSRYQINQVSVKMDKPFLNQEFVNGMVDIQPEKYTTQAELFRLKQKLNSYGYFSQVLFNLVEIDKVGATVTLEVKLNPSAKYDYSVGLGYSTDKGLKSAFKYNKHRLNKNGHQFNGHLNLSEVSNEVSLAYKMPAKSKPATKWHNVQLGYRDEQTDNVSSQTSKLGFSTTRIQRNRWQNINFIDVLHETYDTGIEQGESLLLVPGLSWSVTDADNLARPTRGYKLQSEFKGASADLWSDASFAQLSFSGKFIHSLGTANRLLFRAELGTTASSDFDELPTTYRFFAGGDQSIRGFDYESISPLNAAGDLAGGKHQVVGSIELEHQFASQWAVAAFTDFGDAFSEEFDFKYSVGAGLRWFSPIGPIRIDVGVPLDQDTTNFRLHITVGPDL